MKAAPLVWTQSGNDYNNVTVVTQNGKVVARFAESYEWTTIVLRMRPRLEFGRGGRRQRKRRRAQKLRLR